MEVYTLKIGGEFYKNSCLTMQYFKYLIN